MGRNVGNTKPVVLVTGAARGIGRAVCERATEAAWNVVSLDLDPVNESFPSTRHFTADASIEKSILHVLHMLDVEFGRLDALILNAGVQSNSSIAKTSSEDLYEVLNTNVVAPFLWIKHASSALAEAKGAIVCVSSVHAIATTKNVAAYASSKAALLALARAAALELADAQVRVNCVLPGATDTRMLQEGLIRGNVQGDTIVDMLTALSENHPLRRLARPREIADAVWFLMDSRQSSFITGQSLAVDGGVLAKLSSE